ncbi:MAG: 16S rRNA (guanine(966)-N(2))-methyltransferase RsmD [Clostridia bacterium]|nr:16S rRNA (guanine(966)-N(2))-methyltransferase RsmD [Clostridia bacterium]
MRVITGIACGRRLLTLPGEDIVRPTADRVKEAIFSAIQFDVEGRRVLDLFSGSGQLGIEALSRGAASAVFVDNSPASIDVTKKNLVSTDLLSNAQIINSDYSSFLLRTQETFDIAFLDPPYNSGILAEALSMVIPHMSDYGTVICEHSANTVLPSTVSEFKALRTYRFGTVFVTMFKKEV